MFSEYEPFWYPCPNNYDAVYTLHWICNHALTEEYYYGFKQRMPDVHGQSRPFQNMVSTIWNQMFTGGQYCVTKPPKATFGQSPLDNIHSTLTSANSLSHLNWTWRHNNICLIANIQISESWHLELEFDLINAHSGVVVQIHSCLHAGVHWHLKQTNKCQNVSLKKNKTKFWVPDWWMYDVQ